VSTENVAASAPVHQLVGQLRDICHDIGNEDADSPLSVIDMIMLDDIPEAALRLEEIEDSIAAIRAALRPNAQDQRAAAPAAPLHQLVGRQSEDE
jgi:hypothetical protein